MRGPLAFAEGFFICGNFSAFLRFFYDIVYVGDQIKNSTKQIKDNARETSIRRLFCCRQK